MTVALLTRARPAPHAETPANTTTEVGLMELSDKALAIKTFAAAKQTHDDAVTKGAKCGSQCAIFHKAATPTASKTVENARVFMFLRDIGRQIN
jgi:hypothetical protein